MNTELSTDIFFDIDKVEFIYNDEGNLLIDFLITSKEYNHPVEKDIIYIKIKDKIIIEAFQVEDGWIENNHLILFGREKMYDLHNKN